MIKKWLVKRLFNLIIIFTVIFLISVASYFYISGQTRVNSLNEVFNIIQGDISPENLEVLNTNVSALYSLLFFQIIIFLIATLSFLFTIWFVFKLYLIQKRNAFVDPLTNIYNRRAILFGLNRELIRAKRFEHSISVALLDLDYFKQYNDTNGHIEGDRALKKVAKVLRNKIRESDMVGRFGGEEFLVIFPETDIKGAKIVCENIRKTIQNINFKGQEKLDRKNLTISIGIAEIKKGKSVRSKWHLIDNADKKLYSAKKQRNTIKF